jgi:TRAP transporter T-component
LIDALTAKGKLMRIQSPIINARVPLLLMSLLLSGCFGRVADNMTGAMLNQPDPGIVRDGAPAYLLLIDSLIAGDPKDAGLLRGGASLYGLYAAKFVEERDRVRRLSERSRGYGERALCASRESVCGLARKPFAEFVAGLKDLRKRDVPSAYAWTVSWLVWLKAHNDDWNALADLPKLEAALQRLVELDEGYEHGSAHLYLGILNTVRPAALGGKPEVGRKHFERAIELSGGRDLSFKVEYARYYARMRYDRPLHDRLLQEVLAADVEVSGLVLINNMARQQAEELLASAEDYF